MSDEEYATDAWWQHDHLMRKYTKEWSPRSDLRVVAQATERGVELWIGELRPDWRGTLDIRGEYIWHSSGCRSVITMRELAACINAACNFVETRNPKWASHGSNHARATDEMVVHDD